ncbi:hypothetical protein [Paracraurococcus lichenis]|uniref:Stress-induced protein n=1 Tax=Paracraurococcus lichenis TaxID=3064888 RepID=A0ABT9DX74_9PROT|nr:hypothetical protein [Paracraurococcus sp. LOR1-02]MDO9708491.1 hypothetical protein [Paracraurococcus sp. LOR1-02]
MTGKHGTDHQKQGGQQQGQQNRGQMAQDDRRQESGRAAGTPPTQDQQADRQSHQMQRDKAGKGKDSPA